MSDHSPPDARSTASLPPRDGDGAPPPQSSHAPAGGGERPEDWIGPYKLLAVIGEGGFGVVWLAERREPMVQRVALKIIKPGMDSRTVIARFEQERQALAVMDHPNVAKVLDGGVTPSGRPYFAMEHVKGEPVTDFCDRHRLTIRQRLELFATVCEAVQHAHMKGIIHRDIKPSNILVASGDGGGGPVVKVIDFGVAKAISHTLTEKTIFTERGQIIGTPEYMSPEQAEMGATDIDTRTDVYSLGVVLYELLSGTLPFDARTLRSGGFGEIQRIIREVDPPKPSTRLSTADGPTGAAIARARQADRERLTGELRRELEWVPLMAMRKDRSRRYASAESMAADVRRYLAGQPLEAAPESRTYRLRKLAFRHRVALLAATPAVIALIAGGTAFQVQRGEAMVRAREAAIKEAQKSEAERLARYHEIRAQAGFLAGRRQYAEALEAAKRAHTLGGGGWADGLLLGQIVREARATWQLEQRVKVEQVPLSLLFVGRPGEERLIVGYPSSVHVLDARTGASIGRIQTPVSVQRLVAFRGKASKAVATNTTHGAVLDLEAYGCGPAVELAPGADISELAGGGAIVAGVFDDDSIRVFDLELRQVDRADYSGTGLRKSGQRLRSVAVSMDDRLVLAGTLSWQTDRILWDRAAGRVSMEQLNANTFEFTGSGSIIGLANSLNSTGISTWEYAVASGAEGASAGEGVRRVRFTGRLNDFDTNDVGNFRPIQITDDEVVVAGSLGVGVVPRFRERISYGFVQARRSSDRYSSITGGLLAEARLQAVAQGGRLVAVADDQRILVFSPSPESERAGSGNRCEDANAALVGGEIVRITGLADGPALCSVSIDGNRTAVLALLGGFVSEDPERVLTFCGVAASPDGRTIAVRHADFSRRAYYVEAPTNHAVTIFRRDGRSPEEPVRVVRTIGLGASTRTMENASRSNGARILLLSPAGDRLLVGGASGPESEATLFDTATGEARHVFGPDERLGRQVGLGADGGQFAEIAPRGESIRMRAWADGAVTRVIRPPNAVTGMGTSPDSSLALVSTQDGNLHRIDLSTGAVTTVGRSELRPAAVSPDGEVFLGIGGGSTSGLGDSLVLGRVRDGAFVTAVERGRSNNWAAEFMRSGRGFVLSGGEADNLGATVYEALTPEQADAAFGPRRAALTLASPGTSEARPAQVAPPAPPIRRPLELKPGETQADDVGRQHIGADLVVRGVVRNVVPTWTGGNFNVEVGGPGSTPRAPAHW